MTSHEPVQRRSTIRPNGAVSARPQRTPRSEFFVKAPAAFRRPTPKLKPPVEIGCYSQDVDGQIHINSDQELRHYYPPNLAECHLSRGYPQKYIRRKSPIESLDCLVHCLHELGRLPQYRGEETTTTSTTKDAPFPAAVPAADAASGKSGAKTKEEACGSSETPAAAAAGPKEKEGEKRPKSKGANKTAPPEAPAKPKFRFCALRGLMRKIFCTPYTQDDWDVLAVVRDNTIFLSYRPSRRAIEAAVGMTPRDRLYGFWGFRFEAWCTIPMSPSELDALDDDNPDVTGNGSGSAGNAGPSDEGNGGGKAKKSRPRRDAILNARRDAVVNTNATFRSVVETGIGDIDMILAAEIDCLYGKGTKNDDSRVSKYAELKTHKVVETRLDKKFFHRYKLLHAYFQCWLAGVRHVIVGFRDGGGQVKKIETYKTVDIPGLVQNEWERGVCINFAEMFLQWLGKELTERMATPRPVYKSVRHRTLRKKRTAKTMMMTRTTTTTTTMTMTKRRKRRRRRSWGRTTSRWTKRPWPRPRPPRRRSRPSWPPQRSLRCGKRATGRTAKTACSACTARATRFESWSCRGRGRL
ncbi:RAI1 like PD-XK nuclease-domain-containing protein [Zopfochytrium polystomum]|nr:RAI1 like PD-XK nuclease-domain-containing protein [Zopfochytrium polystomum]